MSTFGALWWKVSREMSSGLDVAYDQLLLPPEGAMALGQFPRKPQLLQFDSSGFGYP